LLRVFWLSWYAPFREQLERVNTHHAQKSMPSLFTSSRNAGTQLTDPAGPLPHDSGAEFSARPSGFGLLRKPKTVFELLKATYLEWNKDKAPRMSAALAYYTIFSLAPLLIIAIAVAGLAFGMQSAQGEITKQIQGLIGPDGARAIQAMIQSAHKPGHGAIAGAIGVLALFLGASGVLSEMQDALNTIWHVNPDDTNGVSKLIKARFLSFGMVLGIGFLLLVSLLLSAVLAALAKYVNGVLPAPAVLLEGLDFLFSLFFITVLFAMIFKLLPRVAVAWTDVWVGAALTSLLFTAGKFVIGFYIGKSVSASAYGAAGSLVIVVAWIYYSALLLYFGAEFTRIYANNIGSRRGQYAT
jgi:membrane protein